MCRKKKDIQLNSFLTKKARKSACTYHVSAVALDRKGNVLGHVRNTHSTWNVIEKFPHGRSGTGKHAERLLISRYGKNIKTIIIARVGHNGKLRPLDPCVVCQKVAKKYGIKIMSISNNESET